MWLFYRRMSKLIGWQSMSVLGCPQSLAYGQAVLADGGTAQRHSMKLHLLVVIEMLGSRNEGTHLGLLFFSCVVCVADILPFNLHTTWIGCRLVSH